MKRLIMSALVLIVSPVRSHADTTSLFDDTGNYARNFDFVGWVPETNSFSILGHNGGDDWSADAQQFTVPSAVHMTALDVSVTIDPQDSDTPMTTPITFQLASGNSRPLVGNSTQPVPGNSVDLTSNPVNFTSGTIIQNTREVIPFDYNLQPGTTYWLQEEGKGGATVVLSEQYSILPDDPPNSAQTPEPPVLALFLALTGYLGLKGKKSGRQFIT